MTPPKPRRKSKTYWFNALMAALAAAEPHLHLIQSLLPVDVYAVISFALVVGNIVLREVTTGPVGSPK